MPIIKSAKKALRSSARKRVYNVRRQSALKDAVKAFDKAVVSGKRADAEKLVSPAYQAIDKAAKRGVLKANTASRKKSRLMASLKKMA